MEPPPADLHLKPLSPSSPVCCPIQPLSIHLIPDTRGCTVGVTAIELHMGAPTVIKPGTPGREARACAAAHAWTSSASSVLA